MRRNDEEFKAELMLRVKNQRMAQRRRRKALSAVATTAAGIAIVTILTFPRTQTESMRETEPVWMYTESMGNLPSKETELLDVSCVQITSVSVRTAQQKVCPVDSAEYDEILAMLEEIRHSYDESSTESAMEVPEDSAESTVISSNIREEAAEQSEDFYQLTIEYGDGHSESYRLLPGESFSIVMSDGETTMYLPQRRWEQVEEEMKRILDE